MKHNNKHITLLSASALLILMSGCAANNAGKTITTTPTPYVVVPDADNKVQLNVSFSVPEHYISRRSRLVVVPQVFAGDSLVGECQPVALYSPIYNKKVDRQRVLNKYEDPYAGHIIKVDNTARKTEFEYNQTVQLPLDVDNARMVAVVSVDGCGECTGIDTIDVASFSTPASLIDTKKDLKLSWIEPEFKIRPKVMKDWGVAKLQFVINKNDINLGLGNNRSELEDIVAKLSPVLNDSLATLNSLSIFGMASADGPLSFNTPLSRNRAISAKNWLVQQLGIKPEVQRLIKVGSRPEGWQPVLDAMVIDDHPDAHKVRAILDRYADQNDDVAERYIRQLACWKDIRAKYLQKDRKVEYVYTYTIRSFTTDAEMLSMYKKRPDAFNEDELLRVASLAANDQERKKVYLTLMKYFPQSAIGANNLAVLYLREGNVEEAQEVLNRQKQFTPEQLNTLAASYVYNGDYERAVELLQDVELPEARYNLGLIKAKQRKLHEAYTLLHQYGDVNSAVIALSLNKNDEANAIMQNLKEATPVAEYVRAMVAARLKLHGNFYVHIGNACADNKLRGRAATEPDFYVYKDDERFKAIVKR